jgi:hypothetical protein
MKGIINSWRRDTTTYLSVYSILLLLCLMLIYIKKKQQREFNDCTYMSQLQRSNRSLNSLSCTQKEMKIDWAYPICVLFLSNTIPDRDLYFLRNRTNTDVWSTQKNYYKYIIYLLCPLTRLNPIMMNSLHNSTRIPQLKRKSFFFLILFKRSRSQYV